MKLYISGPMTGIPQFNFPFFDEVAAWFVENGDEVVSPADHDRVVLRETHGPGCKPELVPGYAEGDVKRYSESIGMVHDLLVWDFEQIVRCDGIVMLPGWENSTGATHERYVAEATGKLVKLVVVDGHGWYVEDDLVQIRVTAKPQRTVVEMSPTKIGGGFSKITYSNGETRVVDPTTGGEKGSKLARFDLVPFDALLVLAEHYGRGAEKYEDRNWEKGYSWSLSFAALQRHLAAWWHGEDIDDEGFEHLTAVLWHALALRTFALRGIGTDDRPVRAVA